MPLFLGWLSLFIQLSILQYYCSALTFTSWLNQKKTEEDSSKDTAVTFRLPAELVKKVKYIAFMDEITQTDIVESALNEYVAKWEKKKGEIPKK